MVQGCCQADGQGRRFPGDQQHPYCTGRQLGLGQAVAPGRRRGRQRILIRPHPP
jgi:hypothetical protein